MMKCSRGIARLTGSLVRDKASGAIGTVCGESGSHLIVRWPNGAAPSRKTDVNVLARAFGMQSMYIRDSCGSMAAIVSASDSIIGVELPLGYTMYISRKKADSMLSLAQPTGNWLNIGGRQMVGMCFALGHLPIYALATGPAGLPRCLPCPRERWAMVFSVRPAPSGGMATIVFLDRRMSLLPGDDGFEVPIMGEWPAVEAVESSRMWQKRIRSSFGIRDPSGAAPLEWIDGGGGS